MKRRCFHTMEERFEHRTMPIPECGCLLWTGAVNRRGYGKVTIGPTRPGRTVAAHRAAFELRYGPIPEGLQVLHRCDVPSCVNPEHLFLGTQQDNQTDMARKGRGIGSKIHSLPRGVHHSHYNPTRFEAQVRLAGRVVSLGTFDTPEEASAAVTEAQQAYWGSLDAGKEEGA